MRPKPLAIDLCAGLGGWTEGLLSEGWEVIGFDIERHHYGDAKYPAQLVLQDILTIHGSQFKGASLIVASPPCQEYSYMAMPWSRAKNIAKEYRDGTRDTRKLTALFDASFRIQAEAIAAAGRFIPLVVENVRGAQPWVGRARANFGSFYLWGDVPALMPRAHKARKFNPDGTAHPSGSWFAIADSKNGGAQSHRQISKAWRDKQYEGTVKAALNESSEGIKQRGSGAAWFDKGLCRKGSKSTARKAASATIAKIPFVLSRHIARFYYPDQAERAS